MENKIPKNLFRRSHDETVLWKKLVLILLFIFVSPFIVLFLLIALLYKLVCSVLIKLEDKNFVKFLDSFDVFWSLEDNETKSIINICGVIESNCPEDVVEFVQGKTLETAKTNGGCKIFYRKMKKYGFYYWRKPDVIDIKEYIKLIDVPTKSNSLDVRSLQEMMSSIALKELPFNGEGMFQVLITKQNLHHDREDCKRNAIIIRVHHSLGDGVTLLEFLCRMLGDDVGNVDKNHVKLSGSSASSYTYVSDLIEVIQILSDMLVSAVSKILKKPDVNSLHGPKLTGERICTWIDDDENLYVMVKAIKESAGVTFTDVILAALSHSLKNYFLKTMERVPENVTIIIPTRLGIVRTGLQLENNFTVNLLDLPINEDLEIIGKCHERLRLSVDALTNTYIVKLCGLLPSYCLTSLMKSRHATLSFSNMPGPKELRICGSNRLKSLVFFTPNKGTTGLGVTALYYGGVLRLAAIADTAVIFKSGDLDMILDSMVAEIKRLHQHYVKT